MSYDDIAAQTATSQPTVTRFIRSLGYATALEFRVASVTPVMSGRLTDADIEKAAERFSAKAKIRVCGTPDLAKLITWFLTSDRHDEGPTVVDSSKKEPVDGDEGLLVPVVSRIYTTDFASVFQSASARHELVVIQTVDALQLTGIPENALRLSLRLEPSTPERLEIAYLISAAADILRRSSSGL